MSILMKKEGLLKTHFLSCAEFAAAQKVTEGLKPSLEARYSCKDVWGNGWVGYNPFYPHCDCPSHFDFFLLKFTILIYSLINQCFQNLFLIGNSLYKMIWAQELLRGLTSSEVHHRLLGQLWFMIFPSVYLSFTVFCLCSFHIHFLLFIKMTMKLFLMMSHINCQLLCQHTSSWYHGLQWDAFIYFF